MLMVALIRVIEYLHGKVSTALRPLEFLTITLTNSYPFLCSPKSCSRTWIVITLWASHETRTSLVCTSAFCHIWSNKTVKLWQYKLCKEFWTWYVRQTKSIFVWFWKKVLNPHLLNQIRSQAFPFCTLRSRTVKEIWPKLLYDFIYHFHKGHDLIYMILLCPF